MSDDEVWRESVRATLRAAGGVDPRAAEQLAKTAVTRGTQRLAARAATRAATVGFALALGVTLAAGAWAAAEAKRAAEATLVHGAPWTP